MNIYEKQISRFLKRREVADVLGTSYQLSDIQISRLNKVFDIYKTPKNIENMLRSIAIMVKNDLTNYVGRLRRLKGIPGTTKYTQLLRYGKTEYYKIYRLQCDKKTVKFPNKVQFWTNKGYTLFEAELKVKEIQNIRNKKAILKISGTSLYSVRSKEFWLSKGYSEEEAAKEVCRIQTTNGIEFYKRKYPADYDKRFNERIDLWQKSLFENNDYDELCLKKGQSIEACLSRGLSIEESIEQYNRMIVRLQQTRTKPSKISQKLFEMIEPYIDGDIYYAGKNYEYLIVGYRVDFYHKKSKTVIEFYGDYFHRNPKKFDALYEQLGYTSQEKWIYDKKREDKIKSSPKVENFIIVWEDEFRQNPEQVVNHVIKEINNGN